MGTAQEPCNPQCEYIMSCKRFDNLRHKKKKTQVTRQELQFDPGQNNSLILVREDCTFVFCMTRNWGSTETASRYTQNAQKILLSIWCEVDGWINKANNAQGTTYNKRKNKGKFFFKNTWHYMGTQKYRTWKWKTELTKEEEIILRERGRGRESDRVLL